MHKRTKVSIGVTVASAAAVGISVAGVVGGATLNPLMIAIDSMILGGVVGGAVATFAIASSITGFIRRRLAEKTQAKAIAQMTNIASNRKGLIKQNTNLKKLSNKLTNSMAYSAKNKQSGMIGERTVIGKTSKQVDLENELNAFQARNAYYNAAGSKKAKKSDKIVQKTYRKLDAENSKFAPILRRYTWTLQVNDPYNHQNYLDHRNEIMCSSTEAAVKFRNMILNSPERAEGANIKDFGYQTVLRFATNDLLKDSIVKSNMQSKMEACELLLLEEVKQEIGKAGTSDGVFPIQLEKGHYTSHKNLKRTVLYVQDEKELDKRIDLLKKYIASKSNVKVTGKNYITRDYEEVKAATAEKDDSATLS